MTRGLLQTTTSDSLPKPARLAEPEKLWSPWKHDGEVTRVSSRLVAYPEERLPPRDPVSSAQSVLELEMGIILEPEFLDAPK